MLVLRNIKKDYKTAGSVVHALKGVSLRFRDNEFVSVLGASGCGKTTLLNIIGGLDHYTSGDLIICGKSTKDYKDKDWDVYRNHRIGFVFQSYNLIPHQTVLGNVELALTIAGMSKAERRAKAKEALVKVGLEKELKKRPNQLSGGQMQRVAIARALVNDPEILLADEPTGALDTETSIQIMDLIREIARERLVIMVTHNPEIAEEYSTRIIRLKDGLVVADSNPYTEAKDSEKTYLIEVDKIPAGAKVTERKAEKSVHCPYCGALYEGNKTSEVQCENCHRLFNVQTKKKIFLKKTVKTRAEKPKKVEDKTRKKERSAMSFGTSLGLSARNLLTKKGRTAVTSIAGSIGIISVCLVLALSNGFDLYIRKTEEDMLSHSPVEIAETSLDVNAIMQGMEGASAKPDLSQLHDEIYVNSFLTNMAQGMQVSNNLSPAYIQYLESMPEEYYTAIQYSYGESLMDNIFTDVMLSDENNQPYSTCMSLSKIKQTYTTKLEGLKDEDGNNAEYAKLAYLVDYLGAVVSKMPGTADFSDKRFSEYVLSQYDVVGGETARFPKNENEAVLVVGADNDILDLTLVQLGFISQEDFLDLFNNTENSDKTIDYAEILNKTFTLYYNDAVYTKNAMPMPYAFTYNNERADLAVTEQTGEEIKITAILRLKEGRTYGCLGNGLNLTEALVEKYISANKQSEIVNWMQDPSNTFAMAGISLYPCPASNMTSLYKYKIGESAYGADIITPVRYVGGSDKVSGIGIYTADFQSKDGLISYLDAWNDTHEKDEDVSYTDTIGLMMTMVETMLNAITYVLVAFTAISLVVSSVMIGIITYVSVVERTKEIGVLRSLGARKKDIKNLFNAETFIIGLTSGTFGVVVTYLLCLGVNAILNAFTGIATLASLPILSAVIMVCVSVALTLISGLIPASSASKKDPVIALRTE